ncbi:hypothetical protein [Clostridium sp.]|uniref:TcaA NTF2-like domain-containing protein n=1 Tax=Clostridium sp. TaxID=1506 RepID=UPI003464A32E
MKTLNKKKIIIIISIVVTIITVVAVIAVLVKNNTRNTYIREFEIYLESYIKQSDKYILGERQSEYDNLISESEKSITNKETSKIDELEAKLKSFESNIIKDNEETLKDTLKEIKKIDTSSFNGKDEIKEKIEEANLLIKDKSFKETLDSIEDINILIEKEKKIAESEKQVIEEAKRKSDAIKVSNSVANRDNAESLVRNYLSNFDRAVNTGDFNKIQYYIYPNSALYNEQKSLIKSWYDLGIKEKFLGFTAKEVTFSEDHLEGTLISEEVFEITDPKKGTRTENFSWLYKFKYNTAIRGYQITEILNP